MKCCQQAVSYSSPQFQFSTGFFAAPPLGCICKRLYKPLKLLGYSLELASQWHSDLKPMPSVVVLLWFVIILWEKGYREKACWFCVSVCVTESIWTCCHLTSKIYGGMMSQPIICSSDLCGFSSHHTATEELMDHLIMTSAIRTVFWVQAFNKCLQFTYLTG